MSDMRRTGSMDSLPQAVIASTRTAPLRTLDDALGAHGLRSVWVQGVGHGFSTALGDARVAVLDLCEPRTVLLAARQARLAAGDSTIGVIVILGVGEVATRPLLRVVGRTVDAVVPADRISDCLPIAVAATLTGQTCMPRELHASRSEALTHRERQVLTMLADGYPNAQIAQELFLAESTVKSHVTRLYTKLGVFSRAEAVAVALDASAAWTVTAGDQRPSSSGRRFTPRTPVEGVRS